MARAAIYAQHCDIYLAPTWDNSDKWVATLRHIAKEGRQFVIGVAPLLRFSDVPEDLRGTLYGLEDDWMSRGYTTIVAPGGEVIAGPVLEREQSPGTAGSPGNGERATLVSKRDPGAQESRWNRTRPHQTRPFSRSCGGTARSCASR